MNCDHPKCDGPRVIKARKRDNWYCSQQCCYLDGCRLRQVARRNARPTQREYERDYKLQRKYGITREQWHDLVIEQSGRCAICEDELAGKVCVDHDHATGAVRGLLCNRCNQGLGYFSDSSAMLSEAARYLDAHRAVGVGVKQR